MRLALVIWIATVGFAAEAPRIRLGQYALWHDPGVVENLDLRYGAGGPESAPQPPFTFVAEDDSGSTPKVSVRDSQGRDWAVKFGEEASPETFCTRLAWAVGYYVEPNYFVASGTIEGTRGLQRARKDIASNGLFHNARFQLRAGQPKFLRWVNWSWNDNPFLGTPELGGLKILMMLLSNWDDKDARDADSRGTNTAIFQDGNLLLYFIDDWGASMGNWGKLLTRSKWNAADFARQSPDFVSFRNGAIQWGYTGQHSALMKKDVRFSDVAWILSYLNRISDQQLIAGLQSRGATEEQTRMYVASLRLRMLQLQRLL